MQSYCKNNQGAFFLSHSVVHTKRTKIVASGHVSRAQNRPIPKCVLDGATPWTTLGVLRL